jgi:outer membrane receptor protein involved in Fe transport
MVRSLLLTFAMLLGASGVILAQQTFLKGKVTDDKEDLIGASIKVLRGTDFVRGAATDVDGNFRIPLDPGSYTVEVSYSGYQTQQQTGVQVLSGKINELNFKMSTNILSEVVVTAYKVPLIEKDKTSTGQTLTSDQIKNLPTRSINAIVATTAGTSSVDGGAVTIKGSRSNATNYYIDGVRVSGTPPPVQDIEQLSVITGGLGAEFGDVTGGVISVVTKGPASDYHGAVEVENSHGLDPYGWLLATANVSGPIIKRKSADGKSSKTLLGFRLSGQYHKQDEDGPSALPVYYVKPDQLDWLESHPLTTKPGFVPFSTASFYTNDSVDALRARPYERRTDIDLTGKLDFRFTDNIDFSVTGTYRDSRNLVDGGSTLGAATWDILNAHRNPTQFSQRYRTLARFRHRLGSNPTDGTASKSAISNAYYTLQFGFERGSSRISDRIHGDNYFDYGYIGRFNFEWVPTFESGDLGVEHVDYGRRFLGYQAGYLGAGDQIITPNPVLNNYNNSFGTAQYDNFEYRNGRFSTVYDDVWGFYSNVGQVFNRVNRGQADIITIQANSGFDLKLGRSGVHNIQFGLLQEQRVERSWSLSPIGLWQLAEQNVNSHFNGLNKDKISFYYTEGQIVDEPIFAPKVAANEDFSFYQKVRESINHPIDSFLSVTSLSPSQLSLDMFSSRELTDFGVLGYYGYDYTGKAQTSDFTFADFFSHRNERGVRDFPVAPLRPLYQAAYIKDKFQIDEMIFSLGMRVERFDLNTQVMRDEYSLYQIMNARDFHGTVNGAGQKPANVGDDYKVYVTEQQGNEVKAYRNGNTWYFADGAQANDGNLIFGGGVVRPYLQDVITGGNIKDPRFDYRTSFEDYKPQIAWLPRIAVSLPISDIANFFAHYDVLVQRPPDNWQVTPLNYFGFYDSAPRNNANLKPEKTIDYEVGYQQKLNDFSALKFSAYYKELRSMIQSRNVLYVPNIGRYESFGNLDFGTVKGFTWQYDLRRKGNIEMRLAYTLQFADGTGTDANSQRGLSSRGNIRTIYPLGYDERHNVAATIDYRYFSGAEYNGPRIGGLDILSNFGINMQITGASGRPYTANARPIRLSSQGIVGSLNGNRLPWRFNVDLRVDKTVNITKGKNPLALNVYLRVANLLNRKNVIGVYRYTSSPTDDGWLSDPEGQLFVNSIEETGASRQAFLDSYSWMVNNPGNFTLPRRIYVGASFAF